MAANECRPTGPLTNFRILDLSSVILGPFATAMLGDLGADVVKVEPPAGDSSRYVTPGRHHGMSGTALNLHRNKRSIVLNLRDSRGRNALLKIAKTADALVHNMRPQAMQRLGLSYAEVRAANPAIVYCACTGYGSAGPYAGQPAYDDLIQGASGLAALLGRVRGQPEYVPSAICDKIVGMAAVSALLAALLHRQQTGEGQEIEVPMFETMVAFNTAEHACDALFEPPAAPFGYARVLSPDRRPYPTRDGYVCLLAYTDRQWQEFFRIVDRPDLAVDAKFQTLAARTEHVDELYGIVAAEVAKRTTAEWLRLCRDAELPAMPVMDLAMARDDPHLQAVNFLPVRKHPSEGEYVAVGVPTHFSATPGNIYRDAPNLGEHSFDILVEAGLTESEINALRESGCLGKIS